MFGEEGELKEQKLFRELNQGRQLANQLLNLLASPAVEDDRVLRTQRALVDAVVRSFEAAIRVLRPVGGRETAGIHDGGDLGSPKREKAAQNKEREGSKRRRVEQTATTIRVIPALHCDDGYGWRKYGQKEILGTGHPRNYFRCTHKNDQGCQALKQVQKLDHDPSLVQVTYKGSHTCKHTHVIPEMDGADPCDEKQGFFLNFETNSMPSGFSFSSLPFFKQEDSETLSVSTTTPSHRTGRSTSSPDFDIGEPFDHILKGLNQAGLDDGDGTCSLPGLDMGLVSFLEFEDLDQSLEFFSS